MNEWWTWYQKKRNFKSERRGERERARERVRDRDRERKKARESRGREMKARWEDW